MAERMVVLKNMVNGRVVVNKPAYGVRRVWNKRNQPMAIEYNTVQQLLWDPGFRNMIDSGILYIENMKDKIDLGLEPVGTEEPVNIIVLTETEMKELLTTIPFSVFKRKVSDLSKVQVDNLISYAVENEIVNTEKCRYLKEVTGKDILASISRKQNMEAEDKAAR